MNEDFGLEDYPIPDWAIGKCNGAYVLGAQLPTRDGRRCGNAHIIHIEPASWDKSVLLHTVLTDAGTTMKLTRNELEGLFHSPEWVSSVEGVIRKFGTKEH